jgi:diguanylate cyclase (GGDEF)-like protein
MAKPATVLVVEDDAPTRKHVEEVLTGHGYRVETLGDGIAAVERVRKPPCPDLLILNASLPRMTGLEVCRAMRTLATELFVPVIMLSTRDDIESKVEGLKAGADDYVVLPFSPRELGARVAAKLRIKEALDKLVVRSQELEAQSITDELTGLLNQRAAERRLSDEFRRAQRYNGPLSVILIDIDSFRSVNERHGHLSGDKVLMEVGELLSKAVREVDMVARFGGEEFMLILPETHFTGSLRVADRISRSLKEHVFLLDGGNVQLTVSLGISFFPSQKIDSAELLVSFAEQALSQAKKEGGNRVCLQQQLSYLYTPGSAE